jgi:glycosyltransferase involved in cell wall biosynthesis
MKHFSIIIPTRGRLKKLLNTLNTIPESDLYTVKIVCDGDPETYKAVKDRPAAEVILNPEHNGSVFCRNSVIRHETDGVFPAVDDVVFEKGFFEYVFGLFNENFPDDDGVVGITQCGKYNPTGMCLVGQKFLHRYPDKLLYHPDFYQFAAQEIHRLCMSTKKKTFILEDKYVVKHGKHHYGNDWIDKTHYEARKHYKRDRNTKILFAKRPPYGRA